MFIPMYQREALWIAFDGASWRPNAVQVAVGKINAISGEAWDERLSSTPQNYLVCPDQPWLDGINVGAGVVRQFVAMPMGMGYSIEGQLTGHEKYGGIQIRVFEPRPGRFPDRPPHHSKELISAIKSARRAAPASMGLGAGGRLRQKIYPDEYGFDTWDQENFGSVFVHILNSEHYTELTGQAPPPTPISAGTYTEHGFPWFELYDEEKGDVAASKRLTKICSIREKDEKGADPLDNEGFSISQGRVEKIRLPAKRRKPPAR
ncbi:MAG TPA: hypothetical protein VF708_13270 [Pyrinomonadaceae bacterium]